MNARTGKLSKRDMDTLNKAWDILSRWTEWAEDNGMDDVQVSGYQYDVAMNAVCGLCEFIENYEMED